MIRALALSVGLGPALALQTSGSSATLILLRHGESEWNAKNRFSGWLDVGLTEHGQDQAYAAGKALIAHGMIKIDECHTSLLSRASDTLCLALSPTGRKPVYVDTSQDLKAHDGSKSPQYVPTHVSWQLNERHYGALTGLEKNEVKEKLGREMLRMFRRDYDTSPMPMEHSHPLFCDVYPDGTTAALGTQASTLPQGESLSECHRRVAAYFEERVFPSLRQGKTVLVAAHNNVLRSLMLHLDGLDPRGPESGADIPKAVPIVYELDPVTLKPRCPSLGFSARFLCEEHEKQHQAVAPENGISGGDRVVSFKSDHTARRMTFDGMLEEGDARRTKELRAEQRARVSAIEAQNLKLREVVSLQVVKDKALSMGLDLATVPILQTEQNRVNELGVFIERTVAPSANAAFSAAWPPAASSISSPQFFSSTNDHL